MVDSIDFDSSEPDFSDDFGFNFDQFNSEPPPPPKGREAVTAAATGAIGGVKDALTDKGNLERVIREVLPEGYGQAYDFFGAQSNSIRGAYREVVDELRPIKNQIKDVTRQIIPSVEGMLPGGLIEKLKNFSESSDSTGSGEVDLQRERESGVQQTLVEIFANEAKTKEKEVARQDQEKQVEQGLEQLRHRNISEFLQGIWENTAKLSEYQDNILVNFQRKSLEIQMLNYGIAGDQFALSKQMSTTMIEKIDAIIQNTALPDYKKIQLSEAAGENLRNKFLNDARGAFFGDTTNYVTDFFGNLGKKARQIAGNVRSGVSAGVGMAGTMANMDSDVFAPNEDVVTKTSRRIARAATEFMMGKGAKALNKTLGKDKRVTGIGEELIHRVNNAGADFKDFMLDPKREGVFDDLRHVVADFADANKLGGEKDIDLNIPGAAGYDAAVGFSGSDSLSIRKVIPGYLSYILREITMLRTGSDAPLMRFDHQAGSFTEASTLGKNVVNRLFGDNRQGYNDSMDKFIGNIDKGDRLSEEQRRAVKTSLYKHLQKGGNTNIETLLQDKTWEGIDPKDVELIKNVFNRHIRTDKEGRRYVGKQNVKRQIELSKTLRSIAGNVKSPAAAMQTEANLGNEDLLREFGIIDGNGRVDREAIAKIMTMSDDDYLQNYGFGKKVIEKKEKKLTNLERLAKRVGEKAKETKESVIGKVAKEAKDNKSKKFINKVWDKVGGGEKVDKLKSLKDSALESMDKAARDVRGNKHVEAILDSAKIALDSVTDIDKVKQVNDLVNSKINKAKEHIKSRELASITDVANEANGVIIDPAPEPTTVDTVDGPVSTKSNPPVEEKDKTSDEIKDNTAQPRAPNKPRINPGLKKQDKPDTGPVDEQRNEQGTGDDESSEKPSSKPTPWWLRQETSISQQQQSPGSFWEGYDKPVDNKDSVLDQILKSIDSVVIGVKDLREPLGKLVAQEATLLSFYGAYKAKPASDFTPVIGLLTEIKDIIVSNAKEQRVVERESKETPQPVRVIKETADKAGITINDIFNKINNGTYKSMRSGKKTLSDGIGDVEGDGQEFDGDTGSRNKRYSSLFQHAKDKLFEKVKNAGKRAKSAYTKFKPTMDSAKQTVVESSTSLSRFLADQAVRARNKVAGTDGDIYVGSEKMPRLRLSALKAGKYFNKGSIKPITSIEDINNDVLDSDGNLIMSIDEFRQAYVGGSVRKSLFSVLKRTISEAKSAGDLLGAMGATALGKAVNTAANAIEFVKKNLPPYDVYVKNELDAPVLLAQLMKNGRYFDKSTGKPIRHPREIAGEVVDKDGNIVLTMDQIKAGLVDVNNAPISSPAARFIMRSLTNIHKGFGFLRKMGEGAYQVGATLLGGIKNFFGEMFTPFTDVISNSKKSLKVLESIYELLDMRLPGTKKKVFGDLDGDGIRDGSVEDRRRKAKAANDERADKESDPRNPRQPSWLKAMGGMLAGIFSGKNKKGKDDDDDDDDDNDRSILEQAADVADIYDALDGDGKRDDKKDSKKDKKDKKDKNKRRRSKKTRTPKPSGSLFKRGASAIGRGALGAGALLGKAAIATTKPVAGFKLAGSLALGAGKLAMATGSAAVSGVGALATLGSFLTWPAVLGATAVAGAGYGAYRLYKYIKKTKLDDMSRVRLAQYGFNDLSSDVYEKVFFIEQAFAEHVKISPTNEVTLDHDKIDKESLMKDIGITDRQQMERFHSWYHNRFRPVLAANLIALKNINTRNKDDLSYQLVDKLSAKDKVELINKATQNMESVHNTMISPTSELMVTVNDDGVRNVADALKLKLDKELEKKGEKPLSQDTKLNGVGASTVSKLIDGAKTPAEMLDRYKKNQELYKVVNEDGTDFVGTEDQKRDAILKGAVKVIAHAAIPKDLVYTGGNRIDALSAIRFKAYGLKEMEASKIRQIMVLEAACEEGLIFQAGKVTLKGNSDTYVKIAAAEFGVTSTTGLEGRKWKEWFNHRFMTVYLAYVNTICTIAKTDKINTAKRIIAPIDQITVANQIIGASGSNPTSSMSSIWKMPSSPWSDYELGDNPDVCKGNLEAIKALAKKIILGEDVKNPEAPKPDTTESDKKVLKENGIDKSSPSSYKKFLGVANQTQDGAGMSAAGDVVVTGKTVNSKGTKMTIGKGVGGSFDRIPNPQGKGWNAVKQTILEAGKLTGVDPRLIAMIAGVESGFDPNSVNPRTKAAGLGNFMPKTWEGMKKYFPKYNIPNDTSPFDARANAIMTGELIKENAQMLRRQTGREMTQEDAYLAHFLGGPATARFFKYNSTDVGAERFPTESVPNKEIFFRDHKSMSGPRTLGEIYDLFSKKMKKVVSGFGISDSDFNGYTTAESMDAANNQSGPTAASAIETKADGSRMVGSATIGQDGVVRGFESKPSPTTERGGGFMRTAASQAASAVSAPRAPTSSFGASSSPSMPSTGYGAPASYKPVVDVSGPTPAPGLMNTAATMPQKVPVNPGITAAPGPKGSINVTITREDSKSHGTFGIMKFPDGTIFHTLELPWKNNERQKSCIPPGSYTAKRRQTTKFGMAFEVHNVPSRSGILIHAGTYAGDKSLGDGIKANSQGCILLGLNRVMNSGQPRLDGTKAAMEAFYQKTGFNTLNLTILPSSGQMNTSVAEANADTNDVKGMTGSVPTAPNAPEAQSKARAAAPSARMNIPPVTPPSGYGASAAQSIRSNAESAANAQAPIAQAKPSTESAPVQLPGPQRQPKQQLSREYNQTPQEIRANSQSAMGEIVSSGFTSVTDALGRIRDEQVTTNKLLENLVNAAENNAPNEKTLKEPIESPQSPTSSVPKRRNSSATTINIKRPIPLNDNPLKMDRLV